MMWLLGGEKILMMYLFILTDRVHERDRQMDRQTPHSIMLQKPSISRL